MMMSRAGGSRRVAQGTRTRSPALVSAKLTFASNTTTSKATTSGSSTTRAGTSKLTTSSSATKKAESLTVKEPLPSQFYPNISFFPFPLGPFFTRRTVRYEVEKDTIWTFEQTQGLDFFCLYTPVRMTVIKLKSGGLWVHAPLAPTAECLRLIRELNAPVEHIVLPTFAYEHKVFVGPFSRKFPKAKVWVVPYQWSFPINLPPQFFGIFPSGELTNDTIPPWADEIDQKVFLPPPIGPFDFIRFTEVAFFHKRTRTMMLTDAVIYVDDKAPDVVPRAALLELGRDNWLARFIAGNRSSQEVAAIARPELVDSPENIAKGWKRMCLLVLFFNPFDLLTPEPSFNALSKRLIVGPVVETLVYNKTPKAVVEWVDSICRDWNIRQVIPCHFSGPVKTSNAEFKRAFSFCYDLVEERFGKGALAGTSTGRPGGLFGGLFGGAVGGGSGGASRPVTFPQTDLKILNAINDFILKVGAVRLNADLPADAQRQR